GDIDRVRIDEVGEAVHQVDARLLHHAGVDAVEALDVGVAALLEGGPVEFVAGHGEAVAGRVAQRVGDAGRVPHDLLRHAADVHAGAPEAVRFDQQHLRAVFRRAPRGRHAAAAAADHQIVVFGHSCSPVWFVDP